MTFHERYLAGCAALAVAALVTVSPTRAQAPTDAALNAEAAQNDWPTHHGTYKSYHYSGLDQINAGNVKNLEVAWMHFPERATRGIQSTPLGH
jgi:glucose dehydrogenase